MKSYLSTDQVAQLLKPINPRRVTLLDGMSHLEAYDVRAHLDRIFGFARWSADVLDVELLFEEIDGEPPSHELAWKRRVSVGYRATLRLTVCAPDGTVLATYTECATGDATNFPIKKRADAHDFSIKTAASQALKRCATNLGDNFGLSLYRNGSQDAVVGRTLLVPGDEWPEDEEVDKDAPAVEREQQPEAAA